MPADVCDVCLPDLQSETIGAEFGRQWKREAATTQDQSIPRSQQTGERWNDEGTEQTTGPPWRLLRTVVRIYGAGVFMFGFVYSSIESACR